LRELAMSDYGSWLLPMMGGAGNGKLLQMAKGNTGAGQLLWVSKYVYWRWEILHGDGRDLVVARWATTSHWYLYMCIPWLEYSKKIVTPLQIPG
jgi:hypothetical protein